MEIVEEKKSGAWKVVLAIFLTTIIIGGGAGAGAFFWQQMEIDNQKSDKDQLGKDKEGLAEKVTGLESKVKGYEDAAEADSKKKREEAAKVRKAIEATDFEVDLGGKYFLTGFIEDVSDSNILYVATATTTSTDVPESETRVFKYERSLGKVTQIYGAPMEGNAYFLLGAEGNKLIFSKHSSSVDNSPGICTNYWVEGEHYVLDISDVSAGMESYTISESDVLTKAKKEKDDCANSLSGSVVQ